MALLQTVFVPNSHRYGGVRLPRLAMWCLGLSLVYFVGRLHPIASWAAGNKVPLARRGSLAIQVEQTHLSAGRKHHIHVEFKRSNSEEEIADKEDREKDQAKGRRQRRRRRSRRASANVSPVSQSTDITIVSFTNYETLELAINWLQHLEDAIGAADMKAALLMYALGDDTQAVLLNTGHIHSSCIRDGNLRNLIPYRSEIYKRGMEAFDQMNILQALLVQSALAERGETSQWILYSSITAVWRGNALPVLTQHQSLEIAAAVDGDFLSTGFMMFNSRQPELKPFLEKWDSELSKWTQQGIEGASPELVFDRIVKSNDFALLKKAELPRSKFLSSGQISKESTNDAYVVQPGGPSAEILSPKQTEKELSDLGLWRGRNGSEDGATSGPDITIISFASYGVLDFALNWLYFVNDAIGPEELKDRLLMYVADESTKKVLLASGLIQEACIRDGTLGATELANKTWAGDDSPGFDILSAQRPRILMHALNEREHKSAAVLYSDVDVVWRRDPFPLLRPLAGKYEVVSKLNENRISTGYFMLKTRSDPVMRLLREWEEESSDGEAEQDVSHEQPEVGRYVDKEQIEVFQLPLSLFPSDSESFRHGIYLGSGLVVHANHVKGDDLIRQALWEAGLWRDIRRGIVSPDPVHAVRRPATSEELRALHDGKSFLSWAKIQWILEEVKSLLRTCQDANDCGLLVFGGVRDMALWERATPPGCPVAFVEENPLVVEASREIAAERGLRVEIHHSDFGGSSFKEWNKRPIRKYAPLLIQGIPSPLQDHMWDVVVVDGPSALVHGRIKSIFWANQVISPDGVAFVDDIAGPKLKLPIERVYADYYFSPGPMEIFTDDSETGSTMGKYMLVR